MGGGLGLVFANALEGEVGEDDSAVAVGFKVDPDIEFGGCVVEVLHARRCADHGQFEVLGDIGGAGAVCVSGLHDAHF